MEYSKIIAEAKERFSNPYPQNFPLPWHLMKYIQKEWSLEVYEKLTRTCKHFYASQPWMIIDLSKEMLEDYSNLCKLLNLGLKKNLKIWVAGDLKIPFAGTSAFFSLSNLTSKTRFSQLLHSIRFSSLQNLSIDNRTLSYSDYITVTEFKSVKCLSLTNTDVTTENDENEICFIDDLLKPLKSIESFDYTFKNGKDFYLECAKRLTNSIVPKNIHELAINKIPEYISFEYFHLFLKKNPNITSLKLQFRIADINNTFINDVQSYYSEDLTYETSESIPQIHFEILIGNVKIEALFYKICKNCNQRVANKFLERRFCPSNGIHWICEACRDAFQPGGPCPFCLVEV